MSSGSQLMICGYCKGRLYFFLTHTLSRHFFSPLLFRPAFSYS
jgi:hypothetical protein